MEPEAKAICMEYNIPITKFNVAKSEADAAIFAGEIGFPVVLKIVSPDIIHKSDAGGVLVNLKTAEEVKAGYRKILENAKKYKADAAIVGVLVQEMAPQSTEVIIGAVKDPQFGQTLMFGLGGIFVEVFEEVALRVAPITPKDAKEMIGQLRGAPILMGTRGHKRSDIEAVAEALLRLSRLLSDFPEIQEIDINPLRVFHEKDGCCALDARVHLAR